MKKIGLIDVDSHNYPNLPLMKISAYHKRLGDEVSFYEPLFGGWYDKVYVSKVFSNTYTKDYEWPINADSVEKGGSGYCINTIDGKEEFNCELNSSLPEEIEHTMPDYELYDMPKWKNTAFGFLTRGCPRGCKFCIVGKKEGLVSHKVANLSEFWNGQRNIEILDPNILACEKRDNLLEQLADTGMWVNFNQGLDARLLDKDVIKQISKVKCKVIHFAMDHPNYESTLKKIELFKKETNISERNCIVYILTNFNSDFENDVERVEACRKIGVSPYVMIYNKPQLPKNSPIKKLQRYANNKFIFRSCKSFTEYRR